MQIKDLFKSQVTRDIPPVVYFHEQSPQKLSDEVSEYIVTGGQPEGHPKHTTRGLHEHYVKLLTSIVAQQKKKGGPELPAAWISGFYGSGKSSFAKLLGLSLDGVELPDGNKLADAWLRRDTSPRRQELVDAWHALLAEVSPIAVVFDIGGSARGDEHIHSAIVRQLANRLGYCPTEPLVADYELKLERDGRYADFLATCQDVHGKPWDELKYTHLVEDDFSVVLHHMFPGRYPNELAWITSRDGHAPLAMSADDAVKAMGDMLDFRAPGKTLFVVVDEVSQYIFQDDRRMLALQSLVQALGQRLKGKAWLLCTGQQKLDDQNDANQLNKLKDRFLPALRVHLDTTNIRDVVHKRLLFKDPEREPALRELFRQHRDNLRLFAYGCEELTEDDFVEVYPMLPKHIDLIMQITSALRTRSTRSQGDDHAIRGLLQMLGELFREQGLADMEVGKLVSLDLIYEVQASALDADVQNTLARIITHCREHADPLAERCAKVVSLLELLQHDEGGLATDATLVARSLYSDLRQGSNESDVKDALERLRRANLLGYSEQKGYKIQSSAGQDWENERRDIRVPSDEIYQLVQDMLELLVGEAERPKLLGRGFPWKPLFSNDNGVVDRLLRTSRDEGPVTIDFRFVPMSAQESHTWVNRSGESLLRDRILWVASNYQGVQDMARNYGKSHRMVRRYQPRRDSLPVEKRRLLLEEEAREESLKQELRDFVAAAFMGGRIYFRGAEHPPTEYGSTFVTALVGAGIKRLPDIYPHFVPTTVTGGELDQLLVKGPLSGPSQKFFQGELGILDNDAGRIVASCKGPVPTRIAQFIESEQGVAGGTLLQRFSDPPYGYSSSVVKACVAGLLLAGKLRVRVANQPELTSVSDAGARDFFEKDRTFRQADIFPAGEQRIKPQDRAKIRELFATVFQIAIEPENEAIADAVGTAVTAALGDLRDVQRALSELPGQPEAPAAVEKLQRVFEDCVRDRQVEPRVLAVRKHLDALREGVGLLRTIKSELTRDAIDAVKRAQAVVDKHYAQLLEAGAVSEDVKAAQLAVAEQLASAYPWRDVAGIERHVDAIREAYRALRARSIAQRGKLLEEAFERAKGMPGFDKLDDHDRNLVLRVLGDVVPDTTDEEVLPPLSQLVDGLRGRLNEALEHARERLSELRAKKTGKVVVTVSIRARDVEIASAADVDDLLERIRERLMEQIKKGQTVRLNIE